MDGFGVLDAIERESSLPEMNVVAMTGGVTRSGYLGNVQLLQKPVEIPRLLVLVDRLTFPPGELGSAQPVSGGNSPAIGASGRRSPGRRSPRYDGLA